MERAILAKLGRHSGEPTPFAHFCYWNRAWNKPEYVQVWTIVEYLMASLAPIWGSSSTNLNSRRPRWRPLWPGSVYPQVTTPLGFRWRRDQPASDLGKKPLELYHLGWYTDYWRLFNMEGGTSASNSVSSMVMTWTKGKFSAVKSEGDRWFETTVGPISQLNRWKKSQVPYATIVGLV